MKTTNTLLIGGAAVAALLLLKNRQSVSGIGATKWQLAKSELDRLGIDLSKDFYTLRFDELDAIVRVMKKAGYKAPGANYRTGSPGRYFWYAMQRKFHY